MSDHHARPARDDVYDHEHEEPRSGRRRRPVADWGVGEDMFEHMPRNRFARDRRGAAARAPLRPRGRRPAPAPRRAATPRAASSTLDAAPPARTLRPSPARPCPRGGVDDGRRTIRIGKDEDLPSEIAAIAADRDIAADEPPRGRATATGVPRAPHRARSAAGRRVRWRPPATSATAPAARRAPRTSASAPGPTASPCGRSRSGCC